MSDWNDIYSCPECGRKDCVPPHNLDSKVLIVGDYPDPTDVARGLPFEGKAGTVLRQFLARLGHDLSRFGVCNLYPHPPDSIVKKKIKYDNPKCVELGRRTVVSAAKGKDVILLIGPEVINVFATKNVSELNGMIINEYLQIPLSAPVVIAMFNLTMVFAGCAGEIKLALQNFVTEVEKL